MYTSLYYRVCLPECTLWVLMAPMNFQSLLSETWAQSTFSLSQFNCIRLIYIKSHSRLCSIININYNSNSAELGDQLKKKQQNYWKIEFFISQLLNGIFSKFTFPDWQLQIIVKHWIFIRLTWILDQKKRNLMENQDQWKSQKKISRLIVGFRKTHHKY